MLPTRSRCTATRPQRDCCVGSRPTALRSSTTRGARFAAWATPRSRAPQIDPLSGPVRLAGSYLHENGRPVFVDCLTGRRLPVVEAPPASGAAQALRLLAAARAALDDAQRAVGDSPGDPVFAIVRGYLVPQLESSGEPGGEALVIAAFERAMRTGRCEDVVRRAP